MVAYTWSAPSPGAASDPANWTPSAIPGSGDDCTFSGVSSENCTWDLTSVSTVTIESDYTGEIDFSVSPGMSGLSIGAEGVFAQSTPQEVRFSGTPAHNSGSTYVVFTTTDDPYASQTARENLTFEINATTRISYDCGHYPRVRFAAGTHSADYIAPTVAGETEARFLSLEAEAGVTFAPASSTPTANDRAVKWSIQEGVQAQFIVSIDSFDGGYATWSFQASSSGFLLPTDGCTAYGGDTGCEFTFRKMVITGTAGDWAQVQGANTLILNDLTINTGVSVKGDDSLGSAIHLVNRPNIKGTWGFHPIADGIYHYKSNHTLGVADGGTGLRRIAPGQVPYGSTAQKMLLSDDLTFTGETLNVKALQFDVTNTTDVSAAGEIRWDENEETLAVGAVNGLHAHIGQTFGWSVKNQTGGDLDAGTVVMAVGTVGASGRILVDAMDASGTGDAKLLVGILEEDVANGGDTRALALGRIKGIDLTAIKPASETWADGDILYCDQANAGGLTNVAPSSGIILPIGFIIHYAANGSLAVRALPIDEGATGGGGGGSGTVTSVAATVPTGFTITGSPITTSGTLAVGFDTGYSLPTTAKQGQWDTAYGWGDHSTQGYLTSFTESDPIFAASQAALITNAGSGAVITSAERSLIGSALQTETDPIFTASAAAGITNAGSGQVITSAERTLLGSALQTETDPVFSASPAASITNAGSGLVTTSAERTNWNAAFGWGDHAAAGYLTSAPAPDLLLLDSNGVSMTAGSKASWNTLTNFFVRTSSGTAPTYNAPLGQITINAAGTYEMILSIVFRNASAGWGLVWSSSYTNYTRIWVTRGATTELGPVQMAYSSSMPNTLVRVLDLQVGDIITPVVYWNMPFSSMLCYENAGTIANFNNYCAIRKVS